MMESLSVLLLGEVLIVDDKTENVGKALATSQVSETPPAAAPTSFPSSTVPPNQQFPSPNIPSPNQLTSWLICLEKGTGDLVGLDVDWGEMDKLRITKVKEGLMSKWNAANPTQVVKAGDYITEINGTKGDARAILDVVKRESKFEMIIWRP
jgi:hypothetical protein